MHVWVHWVLSNRCPCHFTQVETCWQLFSAPHSSVENIQLQMRWYNFKINYPTLTYSGLVPSIFMTFLKESIYSRQLITSNCVQIRQTIPHNHPKTLRWLDITTLCNSWSYRGEHLKFYRNTPTKETVSWGTWEDPKDHNKTQDGTEEKAHHQLWGHQIASTSAWGHIYPTAVSIFHPSSTR